MMPTVVRSRTVEAAPQLVWDVVSNPDRLPEWWPGVTRVEDSSEEGWTTVLGTPAGKSVRADYTLLDAEHPSRIAWRHEVADSPFERILSDSVTELEIEPAAGGTVVRLTTRLRMRGVSRFGGFQVTRATRRQLDGALDGLQALASDRDH
jgi:uncharacterized protein YndB with AHSA1/START domain